MISGVFGTSRPEKTGKELNRSTSRRQEKRKHMSAFYREKVLSVRHWTDTLFSFTATRDSGFRFQNGQFAMIGLEVEGRPLLRAYSMASANHEEELEFFSIKVADGPLTSKLQKIREGDTILVGRKATGTLVTDNLIPGKRLLLLSTGTGLAPFRNRGRIADLITSEQLFSDLHLPPLDIATYRIMMCGSPAMLEELRQLFESRDFLEGSNSDPGHFVIEK